jgi:predicted nucleic acid-binding protein
VRPSGFDSRIHGPPNFPESRTIPVGRRGAGGEVIQPNWPAFPKLADCMIAAAAIRCNAKLATINAPDFRTMVQHGLILL